MPGCPWHKSELFYQFLFKVRTHPFSKTCNIFCLTLLGFFCCFFFISVMADHANGRLMSEWNIPQYFSRCFMPLPLSYSQIYIPTLVDPQVLTKQTPMCMYIDVSSIQCNVIVLTTCSCPASYYTNWNSSLTNLPIRILHKT